MAVALDLITDMLIELGVLAAGEPVNSDDSALALKRVNWMLDTNNTERLMIYVIEEDMYLLPAYVQQPTIGPSGTFVATRPLAIEAANTIDLSNNGTNVSGTTATTGSDGTVLTDSSQNFSGASLPVEPGRDLVYVSSGTGATVGIYRISAVTTTTITLTSSAGANATGVNYTVVVVPQRNKMDVNHDYSWWARVQTRGTTSTPTDLYYAPGYPNGTLNIYPAWTQALGLELFVRTQLTSIATLQTTLSFPPGYYEYLMYNGALRLANAFGKKKEDLELLVEYAHTSKAKVKSMNSKPPRLTSDAPTGRWM
jgi:hypothetical protein